MRPLHIDEIGGAKVARSFCSPTLAALGVDTNAKGNIAMGADLPVEALRNIPKANRDCLIENRFIQVWPRAGSDSVPGRVLVTQPTIGVPAGSTRHVIPTGFGRYMVIDGVMLGTKLSREEAEKLAGKPAAAPVEATQAPAKAVAVPKRRKRNRRATAAQPRAEASSERAEPATELPSSVTAPADVLNEPTTTDIPAPFVPPATEENPF